MLLRRFTLGVCFALLAGLPGGCIFSPERSPKPKPPPPVVYFPNDYPARVLSNLETAYANRDSIGYMALYDQDYLGESYDPNNDSTSTFYWADEQDHIKALAEVKTINGVIYFDLGTETSWTRLPSNDLAHPEWAVIQIPGAQLTIRIDDTAQYTWEVHGTGETFEFTFKPTTPASSSPTDTLWKIIRWKENL